MPSWNIHIAQTERLFQRGGRRGADGCRSQRVPLRQPHPRYLRRLHDAGHQGAHPLPHHAFRHAPPHIPKPRERSEFWDTYVAPAAERLGVRPGGVRGERGRPHTRGVPARRAGTMSAAPITRNATRTPSRRCGQAVSADDDVSPAALERSLFDLLLGTWSHLMADNLLEHARQRIPRRARSGKPERGVSHQEAGRFRPVWQGAPARPHPRAPRRAS